MHRTQRRISLRHAGRIVAAASLIASLADHAGAQTVVTPQREKKQFTDAQIADGFFKVAFGAEFHLGRCACSSTTGRVPTDVRGCAR